MDTLDVYFAVAFRFGGIVFWGLFALGTICAFRGACISVGDWLRFERIAGVLWQTNKTYAGVLIVVLFFYSIFTVVESAFRPSNPGVRLVISYLDEQFESGDTLYIYNSFEHEFDYYADLSEFDREGVLVGISSSDWHSHRREIEFLKGRTRVWFALSRNEGVARYFETALEDFGTRMDKQDWGDFVLYLYNMTAPSQEPIKMPDWLNEMEEPLVEEPVISDEMLVQDVDITSESEENSVEVPEN